MSNVFSLADLKNKAKSHGTKYTEVPVYDGPRLAAGARVDGPALIEEPFTVTADTRLAAGSSVATAAPSARNR